MVLSFIPARRRRLITRVLFVLVILYWIIPLPHRRRPSVLPHSRDHLFSTATPRIQHKFTDPAEDPERLSAVKDEFIHAYQGYKGRAWLHDEVKPLSGGTHTQYCGWAATLIDTLDTLYIMGFEEEFEEATDAVLRMSFKYAPSLACSVNPFEMTIRHLGGLLSAYDMSGSRDEVLKRKAVEMGELLYQAFARNRIQCRAILWPRFPSWPCKPNQILSLARLGSQTLEFLQLSLISGKRKWAEQAIFLAGEMERLQKKSFIPGLWPKFFDGTCEQGLCDSFSDSQFFPVGSGADSAYEYLVKSHLLYGSLDPSFSTMWRTALPMLKKHIIFQPNAPHNTEILFPGELSAWSDRTSLSGKMEHLSCFLGGVFALSSRTIVESQEDLDVAARLTQGCVWAYDSTPSGIMPDTLTLDPCPHTKPNCAWKGGRSRWQGNIELPPGFAQVERPEYLLRPEAIESVFIMYRITGDPIWRERGWRMFTSIRAAARAKYGHAAIENVLLNSSNVQENQRDKMESFWLSETLKYFYLLFADPRLVSLDEWVFNTEGHPFKMSRDYRGAVL